MKKKKCVVCKQKKGRRLCKLHNNEIVCSLCCAEYRNSDCKDCLYYVSAEQYFASKVKKSEPKHFIAEINEEVEKTVDQALAIVSKGDIEKGQAIISELMKEHPRNHNVYYGLGVVNAFKEQYDEAIEYFDKSIDIFPYFIEAHFNKGVAYQKKLDIGNMIKAFKEVVRIGNPKNDIVKQAQSFIEELGQHIKKTHGIDVETYLETGKRFEEAFSCMKKQEWAKAIDGFKECLIKNKNHPQSYGNIGLCYAHLGQKEQALAALDKALEIDPTYEPAIVNRIAIDENLEEGKKIEQSKFQSIEYYKDYPLKKKSLVQSIFQKLGITSNED